MAKNSLKIRNKINEIIWRKILLEKVKFIPIVGPCDWFTHVCSVLITFVYWTGNILLLLLYHTLSSHSITNDNLNHISSQIIRFPHLFPDHRVLKMFNSTNFELWDLQVKYFWKLHNLSYHSAMNLKIVSQYWYFLHMFHSSLEY